MSNYEYLLENGWLNEDRIIAYLRLMDVFKKKEE